jgi:hypothetical protein
MCGSSSNVHHWVVEALLKATATAATATAAQTVTRQMQDECERIMCGIAATSSQAPSHGPALGNGSVHESSSSSSSRQIHYVR